MAENVHFKYPNFCFGPIAGTFCSINQDSATTILRIKNSAGTTLVDYQLSSNIINELIHVEYVGPSDITEIMDSLTFFTVEKVDSTRCIIKRWETRPSSNQLNLKQQFIKYTTGVYYYDVTAAAVEYYETTFSNHNPGGINYVILNNTTRITSGMKLFLGPSNDADNEDDGEYVTVNYKSGNTVYLTSNLNYQYVIGDKVSYYKNVYLISDLGISGDTSRGTIFKINAYNGSVDDVNTDKVYQNINASRWCPLSETVASISSNNMFFINPYASYSNWRSMSLNNLEDDNATVIPYYDVLFDDYEVYFLSNKKLIRDDDYGENLTEDWGSWYNYVQNTLLPYSNTLIVYSGDSTLIGQNISTTIYVKVIDQFGVGLQGKTVNFYIISGDIAAEFTPVNGQVTTDINGEASIIYTSGITYEGATVLHCRTDGASAFTGSQYIWNSIRIHNTIYSSDEGKLDSWGIDHSGSARLRDIDPDITNEVRMFSRSFFFNIGGDWFQSLYANEVAYYLPGLIVKFITNSCKKKHFLQSKISTCENR